MHSIMRRVVVVNATLVALTALAGSAFAAPPSAPPGQEKKSDQATAPAPAAQANDASTAAAASATASGGGNALANGHAERAVSSPTTASSSGINSTSAGVKPHAGTTKSTSCKTGGSMPSPSCTATITGSVSASATSDHSKRYGNATTAAQIAVSRSAPTGTEIRGPGNSQPHKVCAKNGHWIDVHAVKSYAGLATAACTTVQATGVESTTTTGGAAGTLAATSVGATTSTTVQGAAASAAGGVAGASASAGQQAGGVAGAFAEIGGVAGGTLPFTGFPLSAVVVTGIAAIAAGLGLRRRGRPVTALDVV